MKKTAAAQIACWLAISIFVGASILYALLVRQLELERKRGDSLGICGNSYVDPLAFILNFLAPIAGSAVSASILIHHRGQSRMSSPISAAVLSGLTFACLIAYAFWICRTLIPGEAFPKIWWMNPFWKWL